MTLYEYMKSASIYEVAEAMRDGCSQIIEQLFDTELSAEDETLVYACFLATLKTIVTPKMKSDAKIGAATCVINAINVGLFEEDNND